ncbi:MAG TPA: DUF488 domain-containing protein [Mycobacteriales bacterium]|jgi:uncharacterized protein (DUF488 family)
MLFSIGYEGRSAEELLHALTEAGVEVLADVRLNPLSRKPGLSKKRLAATLAEAGIDYVHLPQLGNPRENRPGFARREQAAWDRYRAGLADPAADDALEELGELARTRPLAVLCYERDHDGCHRSLVLAELARRDPSLPPPAHL